MKVSIAIVLFFTSFSLLAQPFGNNTFQQVNNAKDELNPVISPDGRTLFVTLANHPGNMGGIKDPGDIWISTLEEGKWSALVHGGNLINSKDYNAVAGLSSDGNELYLLSHYHDGGSARTQGIAVSRSNGSGWSKPENISIPYFQNKSGSLSGYIQPDKSVFVFSAETYGTRGVDDLYFTQRTADGKWTEPRNLGSTINTQLQELSPSLSADGRTLYFSTNARKGNGSFDVYSSTRLDDTWVNWSEPVNLGSTINTGGRDLFYRDYPALGFSIFTTTENSDGYGDVRMYAPKDPISKKDSVIVVITPPVDTTKTIVVVTPDTDENKIRVYGKVSNAKTGEFVQATITFSAPSLNQSITASGSSGFTLSIPSTEMYDVKIVAVGYVSALEKLDIHTYEMKELEMNFKLQPIEVGTTVNLKNVLFEQSKTVLLTQSYSELDLVAAFLQANPKVKIELAGHTDNRGIPAQNVKLSQARVDKVKDYLVKKGIDKRRITGKGYGGSNPIASNDSEETRQLNRRVEFVIRKF